MVLNNNKNRLMNPATIVYGKWTINMFKANKNTKQQMFTMLLTSNTM